MARKYGDGSDFSRYRPLGAEMRQMENMGNFTLDSDEDDGIRDEDNVAKEGAIVETGVNGFGSHKWGKANGSFNWRMKHKIYSFKMVVCGILGWFSINELTQNLYRFSIL